MNVNKLLKPALYQLLVVLGFIAISFAYFSPVITGKSLPQMDDTHAQGMSQEIVSYEQQYPGEVFLWTNSMFGGMPAYQIKGGPSMNIFSKIQYYLRFGLPYTTVSILFILLLGFYFMLQLSGFKRWLSILGAIGFAFASYNIIIISAGHITKAYAIAYMPFIFAGILLVLNKKYLVGGFITTLGIGLEIACNHVQITYYTFLIILILFVVQFVFAIREKYLKHFAISVSITLLAAFLALLPNITSLWTTYEYGQLTTRGPSELTKAGASNVSSGLDKDYALAWSYGVSETFCVMVPNFMGAGVQGFKPDSKTAETLTTLGLQDGAKVAASMPAYWGRLPFTVGPAYFGSIICFLFVFGLFVVKGPVKWWLLSAAALSFLLAWGKNFSIVTDIFFYYFPGYNKFRTVDMILVIANFSFALLGLYGLKEVLDGKVAKDALVRGLKYAAGILGGLLLLFVLIPGWFFDFTSLQDNQLINQLQSAKWPSDTINQLMASIRDDRESIMRADAFRSLLFVILAAGLVWALVNKKLKGTLVTIALMFLILIDLWSVDRRYLNNDNFVSKSEAENQFARTKADDFILQDKDPNYRVLNLARNTFNDAYTPYYHKSIGGYHGAKLKRYQDMIDGPISADIAQIQQIFRSQPTNQVIFEGMRKLSALNMLNARYIIYNPDAAPIVNSAALGNAWFVDSIKWVKDANEEYAAVSHFNPATLAVIDQRWKDNMMGIETIAPDTARSIKLDSYKPTALTYSVKSSHTGLVVFSEIFYDKGWNAYIDGKEVPYGRANFILRTLVVPAGVHNIAFRFEPKTYNTGQTIALISSIAIALLIIVVVVKEIKQAKKAE